MKVKGKNWLTELEESKDIVQLEQNGQREMETNQYSIVK